MSVMVVGIPFVFVIQQYSNKIERQNRTHNNIIIMMRSRDIAALVAALVLSRMAWNDSTESLKASAHLAFYFPRGDQGTVVSPMDLDGDGTNEALVVVQRSSSTEQWEWKILDLKALHPRRKVGSSSPDGSSTTSTTSFSTTALPPFQPPILFSHKEDSSIHRQSSSSTAAVTPIQITTGQVLVEPKGNVSRKNHKVDLSRVDSTTEINERNRHYFCGMDWHDASQKCSHPCPTGQATECPEDQRCYADTPCDIQDQQKEQTQVLFELTPGGGLPSVVTLWSDGVLALSSLMNSKDKAGGGAASPRKGSSSSSSSLELRTMWNVQLLPEEVTSHQPHSTILWVESNVLFLDAYDSTEALGADHGMIVVSGIYAVEMNDLASNGKEDDDVGPKPPKENSFLIAVDAMKGKILWDTFSDSEKHKEPLPLPLSRGVTSYARRRSRMLASREDPGSKKSPNHPDNLPNCQVTFRQHMKQVLPYAYWTFKDSHVAALHLDQSKKHTHQHKKKGKHPVIGKDKLSFGDQQQQGQKKKWHHRFHKPKHPTAVKGRPNVIVTQTRGGLQIRALRNGRPLCHMSLLEETLYADLNNDGTMDQVQVLLQSKKVNQSDKWIRGLLNKVQKDTEASSPYRGSGQAAHAARLMSTWGNNLCHAMALSGIPAREELFSTSLCGTAHERVLAHPSMDLDAVAPVVVESLSGRRNTRDVVIALNNGMVHRLQGRSGRKEWSLVGNHHDNFPTWEASTAGNAVLTRVQSFNVPAPLRPILLAGENSLAVLSAKNGNILASVPFPQTSNARPILAEVSGDGTTDVIVMSMDGIWGFQIQVQPGRPITLRILVGLLLFMLMLAILRNRFGQRKDIRATDL